MDKKQNKKYRNKEAIQFILSNRDSNDPNYNNPNASQKILLQVNNDEDLTKEQKKIIEQIPKISRGIFDEKEATKLLLNNNSNNNDNNNNKTKVSFNFGKNEIINFNKNEKILNKNKKNNNNDNNEEEIDTSSKKLENNKNINDFIKSNEDLINDEKYIKEILKKVKVKAKIVEYNEFGLPKDTDPEVLKYASNKEFIEGVDIFIPAPVNNETELKKFDTDIKEENMDEEMKELEKELKSDSEEENNNNNKLDNNNKNIDDNKKNEIIEEGNIEDNFILLANGGELPIEFINDKEEEDKKEEDEKEENKKENEKNENENIVNKYTKSNQYKYISKEEIDYVFKKFEEEERKKKNNKNNNNNKNNFSEEEEDEEYEDYELDEEALMDYNRDDLNENKEEEKNKENDLFYPNIKIEYVNKNDEPNPFANDEEKKKLKKKRQNKKEFKKSKSKQYAIDKEENYTDDSFTTGELDNKITDKDNIEKTLELYNNLNENEEINEDKINKEIEENYIFEPKIKENINEVEYKIKNLPKSVKEVKKEKIKKIKKNNKNENNNDNNDNNINNDNNNNNNEFEDDLKKEGINDKKLRKKLLKMERREKRIEKKKLKNLFKEEKKHQEQIIANTNKIIRYGLSVKDL